MTQSKDDGRLPHLERFGSDDAFRQFSFRDEETGEIISLKEFLARHGIAVSEDEEEGEEGAGPGDGEAGAEAEAEADGAELALGWVREPSRSKLPRWRNLSTGEVRYQEHSPGVQRARPEQWRPLERLAPEDQDADQVSRRRAQREYHPLRERYLARDDKVVRDDEGQLKTVFLDVDAWRELLPEYQGTNAHAVHRAAGYLDMRLSEELLREMQGKGNNRVAFLSGGGGSGKTTAFGQHFADSNYPLVLDQTGSNEGWVTHLISEAKEHGYEVDLVFVDRHPRDAWFEGVVGRALRDHRSGRPPRTVPLEVALRSNIKARETALRFLRNNPEYSIKVIDNNRGKGRSVLIEDRAQAIEYLERQKHDYESLLEELSRDTRRLHEQGTIPPDIARGLIGGRPADDRRSQPGPAAPGPGPQGGPGRRPAGPPPGTGGKGPAHAPPAPGGRRPAELSQPADLSLATFRPPD